MYGNTIPLKYHKGEICSIDCKTNYASKQSLWEIMDFACWKEWDYTLL